MRKVMHLVQHICFVVCCILLFQLIFFGYIKVDGFKGNTEYLVSIKDANTKFVDSDILNRMLGSSAYDVLNYGGLKHEYDNTPELRNSVSANSIGRDIKPDLEKYSQLFDNGNTNINYFISATFEDGVYNFGNINIKDDVKEANNKILNASGIYIYYDLQNDKYETNSRITESTIEKLIANSDYAYASDIKFMMGLNKDLDAVNDVYKEAAIRYSSYTNYCFLKLVLIVAFSLIYIILMLLLLSKEGIYIDKENKKKIYKVNSLDLIPIEFRALLLLIVFSIIGSIGGFWDVISGIIATMYISNNLSLVLVGVFFFLFISLVIDFYVYGFIRRLRSHVIWKTSYLRKLVLLIKGILDTLYTNANIVLKAVVPYLIVLIINVLVTIAAVKTDGMVVCCIFLIVIDGLFGYLILKSLKDSETIYDVLLNIAKGDISSKVDTKGFNGNNVKWADAVNNIGQAVNEAVEKSMKDEKMKADLITNVSHDLKTPLTSIINYVDLLKKEKIDNENAINYINILDEKSQRLKQLTDDLVEASKISSGNVVLNIERINLKELILQTTGEFVDKFEEKGLAFNGQGPEEAVYINADSRSIFRVIENLFNNIYKYALEGTRVYLNIETINQKAVLTIKNISANPLNVTPEELTERFIRGDESRTTEGSGLGLSIAKSLTEAMGGTFELNLDGDLFKVILTFDLIN